VSGQAPGEAETVRLRPLRLGDAAELIRANRASRAFHLPWVEPPVDMPAFEVWFGQTLTGPNLALVAREPAAGAIVGVVNLSQIVWGVFRSAYLGYYAMGSFAGRGFMTEALRQATGFAFDELGLHRLEANIQPGNVASLALVRRLGFAREGFSPRYLRPGGEWRDHERWALVRDQTAP